MSTKSLLSTAVFTQIMAIIYLTVVDLRIMSYSNTSWNTDLGYVLLIPFIIMIGYAWACLFLCIQLNILQSQVWTDDREWEAKDLRISDKHTGLAEQLSRVS